MLFRLRSSIVVKWFLLREMCCGYCMHRVKWFLLREMCCGYASCTLVKYIYSLHRLFCIDAVRAFNARHVGGLGGRI